jgi:hypothetical protein
MNRPTLLLALGAVALGCAAGCSSLTKPDEIHVLADEPPSVQAPAAAGQASPQPGMPQPGAPQQAARSGG